MLDKLSWFFSRNYFISCKLFNLFELFSIILWLQQDMYIYALFYFWYWKHIHFLCLFFFSQYCGWNPRVLYCWAPSPALFVLRQDFPKLLRLVLNLWSSFLSLFSSWEYIHYSHSLLVFVIFLDFINFLLFKMLLMIFSLLCS